MQTPNLLRNLIASDIPAVESLYRQNPTRWQNIRMNIEGFGIEAQSPALFGAFREGRVLCGVLMRFPTTVVVVDLNGECAALFAQYVDQCVGIVGVRGSSEAVTMLAPLLQNFDVVGREPSYYMEMRQPVNFERAGGNLARPATLEDIELLAALYARADRMYRSRSNILSKLGKERIFLVEEPATNSSPKRIASCALLNVEGSDRGLIGGVFTLPEARGKGYATACTSALAKDLQRDGKIPCLFYENPTAGRIYRGLGFQLLDNWLLLFLVSRHLSQGSKR